MWYLVLVHSYHSVWRPCEFSFFLENFVPVCRLLCYTVAYRGLNTRVSLLDSRVQYASFPYTQLCTSLGIGISGLGFVCPYPSLIFVCWLVFLISTLLLVWWPCWPHLVLSYKALEFSCLDFHYVCKFEVDFPVWVIGLSVVCLKQWSGFQALSIPVYFWVVIGVPLTVVWFQCLLYIVSTQARVPILPYVVDFFVFIICLLHFAYFIQFL